MSNTYLRDGIIYKNPTVYLLNHSGIGIAEFASRTAYKSYDKSTNPTINNLADTLALNSSGIVVDNMIKELKEIKHSPLVDNLIKVVHHDSIGEHIIFQFYIKDISRGVLQELARHRIGTSLTVQSTRYTMSSIINAMTTFIEMQTVEARDFMLNTLINMNLFVINDHPLNKLECNYIIDRLYTQYQYNGRDWWYENAMSKEQRQILANNIDMSASSLFTQLENAKQKRNVGDPFKHIVTDNWATSLVLTLNLRSLRHFLKLRNTNAAWFQINKLAQTLQKTIPEQYQTLL